MAGYWSSLEGLRRQRRRRLSETLLLGLNLEPQRKGRRGTEQSDAAFRLAVRQNLVRFGLRGWARAPLALDFSFTTTLHQPAAIEAYAKHYQDLLQPRSRDDDRPPFLYNDDRQVKMLFVQCWHHRNGAKQPHLFMKCRPRRHAIAEMENASLLDMLSTIEKESNSSDWDDATETRATAVGATRQALQGVGVDRCFDEWFTRYMAYDARRAHQTALLHANNRLLTHLLISRASSLITRRPDPTWRALTRLGIDRDNELSKSLSQMENGRSLLDMLIRVMLPSLPVASGGRKRFREELHRACEGFVLGHPYLRPLLVPLRITLLVVPPRQGKDLDNIVIDVVRAVNSELEPYAEPWRLAPKAPLDRDDGRRAEVSTQTATKERVGITSYEVIELARSNDDPTDGTLTMVLGHGDVYTSTWEAAASFVDKRLDEEEL